VIEITGAMASFYVNFGVKGSNGLCTGPFEASAYSPNKYYRKSVLSRFYPGNICFWTLGTIFLKFLNSSAI